MEQGQRSSGRPNIPLDLLTSGWLVHQPAESSGLEQPECNQPTDASGGCTPTRWPDAYVPTNGDKRPGVRPLYLRPVRLEEGHGHSPECLPNNVSLSAV